MDINARLAISYFERIAAINEAHGVYVVQHRTTRKIYVQKILSVYNLSVYQKLMQKPVPGLPRIYELYEEKNILIVIEEYISGKTIEEILENREPVKKEQVADWMLSLCRIIQQLHAFSPAIIHRDIKPSNVMITTDGRVILLDLNAAKNMDSSKEEDTRLLGTKGYAAPEQFGFGSSDTKTDIYAAGALLGTISDSLGYKDFQDIIDKSMQLNPQDRYQTIDEMGRAIQNLKLSDSKIFAPLKYHKWFPPGFRSGNPAHMILAILGYAAYILFFHAMGHSKSENVKLELATIITVNVASIAFFLFTANYGDIHKYLPFCRSQKMPLRILGVILFGQLIFWVVFIIGALITAFL